MTRQPVPGEVWTYASARWIAVCALPDHPDYGVFRTPTTGNPVACALANLTPPPELPPAELVAALGEHWINVYPGGHTEWYAAQNNADAFAGRSRVWLVHPDGRWQKCNGNAAIGDPVEVPR